MNRIIFSLFGAQCLAEKISDMSGIPIGCLGIHTFPDGETLFRVLDPVADKDVCLVARLDDPDTKMLSVLMIAEGLRQQGAGSVTLIAPYLPYMRQDIAFSPGELVSATAFAKLVSNSFDRLITVDPHLHRFQSLDEVYTIPTTCVSAAKPIVDWVADETEKPMIIGPDEESDQWVSRIARHLDAPYQTLRKTRHGDRDVEITLPTLSEHQDRTLVLVDDIISSGATMLKAVAACRAAYPGSRIVCCVTHFLAGSKSIETLRTAGIRSIAATDTVRSPVSSISTAGPLARALDQGGLN